MPLHPRSGASIATGRFAPPAKRPFPPFQEITPLNQSVTINHPQALMCVPFLFSRWKLHDHSPLLRGAVAVRSRPFLLPRRHGHERLLLRGVGACRANSASASAASSSTPRTCRSGRARRDRSLHGRQCREDLRIPGFCQRIEGTLCALRV